MVATAPLGYACRRQLIITWLPHITCPPHGGCPHSCLKPCGRICVSRHGSHMNKVAHVGLIVQLTMAETRPPPHTHTLRTTSPHPPPPPPPKTLIKPSPYTPLARSLVTTKTRIPPPPMPPPKMPPHSLIHHQNLNPRALPLPCPPTTHLHLPELNHVTCNYTHIITRAFVLAFASGDKMPILIV